MLPNQFPSLSPEHLISLIYMLSSQSQEPRIFDLISSPERQIAATGTSNVTVRTFNGADHNHWD